MMACNLQKLVNRRVLHSVLKRAGEHKRFMSIEDLDKPVKFSSSKAATWKAEFSRHGAEITESKAVWYQPLVVSASIAAFLLYFCVLREENDIDDLINSPLYDRIDGLEESQLKALLQYNFDKGLPTEEITTRLKELQQERIANQAAA